jgi:hypothetical protein
MQGYIYLCGRRVNYEKEEGLYENHPPKRYQPILAVRSSSDRTDLISHAHEPVRPPDRTIPDERTRFKVCQI